MNEAVGLGLSKTELVKYAALGEVASAGAPHADNVSSAIMGFFTIVISSNPIKVVQLPPPKNVEFVIAIPDVPELNLKTAMARSVIPKKVKLSNAIHNIAYASAFIAGVTLKDVVLMGEAMKDLIAEPYRASLIPSLKDVKNSAIKAGALGVAISGAGPSILALIDSRRGVEADVAEAMKEGFERNGIKSEVVIVKPGPGAKIVRRKGL
ncbi:MAG: homoserine kinase [Candidatus Bathyarchaeia archaeon]